MIQYSDALALAYPYIDFYKSVNYTQHLLDELGFTNTASRNNNAVSRAVLLQEGQFMLGASRVVKDFTYSDGTPKYDTFMTTRESLSYFGVDQVAPLYSYNLFGVNFYVLPYWITAIEGGVLHHTLWFQDGENVNSGEGQTWEAGGYENLTGEDFPANPARQRNHEERLMDLERQGNMFLTLDEWVQKMIDEGHVKPLGRWVPETHWNAFQYRSSFIWMGETAGGTAYDDSEINARNYQTHQVLLSTELLLNYSSSLPNTNISDVLLSEMRAKLERAWLDLAEAEVTDSTGLSPRPYEGQTAIDKTTWARNNASEIQRTVINLTTSLNQTLATPGSPIQVLPYNLGRGDPVVTWNESEFIKFDNSGPPVGIDAVSPIGITCINNDSFSLIKGNLSSPWNPEVDGKEYYRVQVNFPRTNTSNYDEPWCYVKFSGDFSSIRYSPSLYENETIQINRGDYNPDIEDEYKDWDALKPDNFEIYIALANGLVYSENGHYAIIKNNSASHVAVKWNDDYIRFMQTETRSNLNPSGETWEYFILMNVTADQAVIFANLINPNAPYTISEVP
ncbi:MAG: hypothetical protein ACTSWN_02545 [Promethearchaeota archaeon]